MTCGIYQRKEIQYMKKIKNLISAVLSITLVLSSLTTVYAADTSGNVSAPKPYDTYAAPNRSVALLEETAFASVNGMEVLDVITDPAAIQKMVDDGLAEVDEKGNLPTRVTTYFAPDVTAEKTLSEPPANLLRATPISVSKTRYYDGRYFDDYDRYKIDGKASFEVTYSKKGSSNWNASMSGNVTVGGTVYGVADLKASVSSSVGYSFGVEETKTQKYSVSIPDKKYWEIKVYVSYLVYEYTAKVGTQTISIGKTWKPNGLVIEKAEYNK